MNSDKHSGQHALGWPIWGTVAVFGLACFIWLTLSGRPTDDPDAGVYLQQLVAGEVPANVDTLARARRLARVRWSAVKPSLPGMLTHADSPLRSLACQLIADQADPQWLPAIIPRTSDSDWRVRSAAFEALGSFHPVSTALPLRDTPLDEREVWLLQWIKAHDAQTSQPLLPHLCELYADLHHVEVGQPLTQQCLRCHVGQLTVPQVQSNTCQQCHSQIYEQWIGSAHAQSLSHLRLTTVDPATRQVKLIDFSPAQGIQCTECHRLADGQDAVQLPQTHDESRCQYTFAAQTDPYASCIDCHETTYQQWQQWRSGVQPQRAEWPPGQIQTTRDDQRTCVDCHMPSNDSDLEAGFTAHHFSARRNINLLRQGIDVSLRPVERQDGKQVVPLVVTNLAGHAYPAATRRRALQIHANGNPDQPQQLIATLVLRRRGEVSLVSKISPALGPGESRTFLMSLPASGTSGQWTLIYLRDRFQPDSYTIDIAHVAQH